jgi:large subunit ribosomal protein L35
MPWRPFLRGFRPAPYQNVYKLPKLKTKCGVKKRFKLRGSGMVMAGPAGKRHRLMSHKGKYIRQNRGTDVLAEPDAKRVKLWIPYGLD